MSDQNTPSSPPPEPASPSLLDRLALSEATIRRLNQRLGELEKQQQTRHLPTQGLEELRGRIEQISATIPGPRIYEDVAPVQITEASGGQLAFKEQWVNGGGTVDYPDGRIVSNATEPLAIIPFKELQGVLIGRDLDSTSHYTFLPNGVFNAYLTQNGTNHTYDAFMDAGKTIQVGAALAPQWNLSAAGGASKGLLRFNGTTSVLEIPYEPISGGGVVQSGNVTVNLGTLTITGSGGTLTGNTNVGTLTLSGGGTGAGGTIVAAIDTASGDSVVNSGSFASKGTLTISGSEMAGGAVRVSAKGFFTIGSSSSGLQFTVNIDMGGGQLTAISGAIDPTFNGSPGFQIVDWTLIYTAPVVTGNVGMGDCCGHLMCDGQNSTVVLVEPIGGGATIGSTTVPIPVLIGVPSNSGATLSAGANVIGASGNVSGGSGTLTLQTLIIEAMRAR